MTMYAVQVKVSMRLVVSRSGLFSRNQFIKPSLSPVYPYSGNSRSVVGRNAHTKFKEKPTMYLYLDPTKEEKKFRRKPQRYKRTIRHEFGHALGLKHEHQHPLAPPQYDHEALKSHLMQEYELTEAKIEEKIKINWATIHSREGVHSKYDRDSVMHYV